METLQDIWDWVFNTPVKLSLPWYALYALIIIGAATRFFRYTYKLPKLLGSLVHEAGHASMALLMGLQVSKIKLDSKGNGVTEFYTRPGLRNIFVALAGYLTPAALAMGLTYLITSDNLNGAIALLSITFLVLAIFVRSLVGIFLNTLFGGLLYLILTLSQSLSTALIVFIVGVLLSAGVMGVWEAYMVRTRKTSEGATDSQVLAKLTFVIPSIVWDLVFAAINLLSVIYVILFVYRTI